MSQHQMDSGEIDRDGQHASYTGYEGTPNYRGYASSPLGQKLSADNGSSSISAAQRLALAIVSLVLWVVVFFIVGLAAAHISPDSPGTDFFYPFLMASLLIFSVLVLVINILFYRKH